jgi:hypothetical protein
LLKVEHRERVQEILEESESTSSGGIVPFVLAVEADPGNVLIGQSLGSRRISKRKRIDDLKLLLRIAKSR